MVVSESAESVEVESSRSIFRLQAWLNVRHHSARKYRLSWVAVIHAIWILVGLLERCSIRYGIDVAGRYQVTRQRAHVRQIQRGARGKFLLYPKTEAVNRGYF